MRKFRVWWVEDNVTRPAEIAFADAFGKCAHTEVFRTGTEVIEMLSKLSKMSDAADLPNVALIDLKLVASGEKAELIGQDKEGRGFVVAAELVYKSARLRIPSDEMPRYVLYTGSQDVKTKFGAAAGVTPSGHPALLHLEGKGQADDEIIVEWAVEELHALALKRISEGVAGIECTDVTALHELYLNISARAADVSSKYLSAYNTLVQPAVDAFIREVGEDKNAARLPIRRLQRAEGNIGKVVATLTPDIDWPQDARDDLVDTIEGFELGPEAAALNEVSRSIAKDLRDLCASRLIERGDGPLAVLLPSEVAALLKGGHVNVWLPTLGKIIEMLSVGDFNLVLARILKKLQVSINGVEEGRELTAFAYAAHEVYRTIRGCQHCRTQGERVPICVEPNSYDFISACVLRNFEWQGARITEALLSEEVKALPSSTIQRLKADGTEFAESMPALAVPGLPLLSFAARYSHKNKIPAGDVWRRSRENWHEKWSVALGHLIGSENVKCSLGAREMEPSFLTDWREIFGSGVAGAPRGLLPDLKAQTETACTARVSYDGDSNVSITMTWVNESFASHKVDQIATERGGGGDLSLSLQALQRWGNVLVRIKNEREGLLKVTNIWFERGQERKHLDASKDSAGFELIWKLRNYLERRRL